MKPTTVATQATAPRPSRTLVALAAAWMILSLAIGGAVAEDSREEAAAPAQAVTGVTGR